MGTLGIMGTSGMLGTLGTLGDVCSLFIAEGTFREHSREQNKARKIRGLGLFVPDVPIVVSIYKKAKNLFPAFVSGNKSEGTFKEHSREQI
jgi:hypothetical protein